MNERQRLYFRNKLKAWKEEPADSFSRVVLKVVPRKGTLAGAPICSPEK